MKTIWSYENRMAKSLGFECTPDPKRGGNWCSFRKGTVRVWESMSWIRADLIDNRFRNHTKHSTLAEALLGINGTAFGPDSSPKRYGFCNPPERVEPLLDSVMTLFPLRDDFVNAAMASRLFREQKYAEDWWDKKCRV